MAKKQKNNKFNYPMQKEAGWLGKGSYTGDIKSVNYSSNSFFEVLFKYYLTNNYLRNMILTSIISILLSTLFFALLNHSNAVQFTQLEGNIFHSLGKLAILKMSCLLGSIITTFIVGYSQLNYLILTKSRVIYLIGFIFVTFVILFCITFGYLSIAYTQYNLTI